VGSVGCAVGFDVGATVETLQKELSTASVELYETPGFSSPYSFAPAPQIVAFCSTIQFLFAKLEVIFATPDNPETTTRVCLSV
jgi:hypothetical protein